MILIEVLDLIDIAERNRTVPLLHSNAQCMLQKLYFNHILNCKS